MSHGIDALGGGSEIVGDRETERQKWVVHSLSLKKKREHSTANKQQQQHQQQQ